jgi:hypothetical protein
MCRFHRNPSHTSIHRQCETLLPAR